MSRLFADRSGSKQTKKTRLPSGCAAKLARALAPLAWDPLRLNAGASRLHEPLRRCLRTATVPQNLTFCTSWLAPSWHAAGVHWGTLAVPVYRC